MSVDEKRLKQVILSGLKKNDELAHKLAMGLSELASIQEEYADVATTLNIAIDRYVGE